MNKIEKINISVSPSGESGIFHDSRKDIRTLSKVVNVLIEKINELVESNNNLSKQLSQSKTVDNG